MSESLGVSKYTSASLGYSFNIASQALSWDKSQTIVFIRYLLLFTTKIVYIVI